MNGRLVNGVLVIEGNGGPPPSWRGAVQYGHSGPVQYENTSTRGTAVMDRPVPAQRSVPSLRARGWSNMVGGWPIPTMGHHPLTFVPCGGYADLPNPDQLRSDTGELITVREEIPSYAIDETDRPPLVLTHGPSGHGGYRLGECIEWTKHHSGVHARWELRSDLPDSVVELLAEERGLSIGFSKLEPAYVSMRNGESVATVVQQRIRVNTVAVVDVPAYPGAKLYPLAAL